MGRKKNGIERARDKAKRKLESNGINTNKVDAVQLIAEFSLYYDVSPIEVLKMPWCLFISLCEYKSKQTKMLNRIYDLLIKIFTKHGSE